MIKRSQETFMLNKLKQTNANKYASSYVINNWMQ